ncbi:helix-turn-helix domain-containing protein [Candidatus Poriferisocius sp.]|uniref:helix-turn-helix domain-containing protein n=1 Tax=Candidatus Poriferisocius sp. TaxID=3101276 RepID=UPI003B01E45C
MAQRLCASERAHIETMVEMGVGAGEMARRLGRCRSTVWQELRHNGDGSTYRADAAQAGAEVRALRPRVPRLAADRVLGDAVAGSSGEPLEGSLPNLARRVAALREVLPRVAEAIADGLSGDGLAGGGYD